MKARFTKYVGLVLLSIICLSVSAQTDLGARSQNLNKSIYVDVINGSDTLNDGSSTTFPLQSISAAITEAYGYGKAYIYLANGTYPSSSPTTASDNLVVSGHPWVQFSPVDGHSVILKHGFRLLGGSKVNFKDINFVQDGEVGNTQIDLENSHVFIDDGTIKYTSGDVGFLRAKNSWAHIRINEKDGHLTLEYENFPLPINGKVPLLEADYGSYISLTGKSANGASKWISLKLGAGNNIGIYLTASKMYGSNVNILGNGPSSGQTGILLNRVSEMRLLTSPNTYPYIYQLHHGIHAQNGSSAMLSGPMRIRFNSVALRVSSGADIRHQPTASGGPAISTNTEDFEIVDSTQILKAY